MSTAPTFTGSVVLNQQLANSSSPKVPIWSNPGGLTPLSFTISGNELLTGINVPVAPGPTGTNIVVPAGVGDVGANMAYIQNTGVGVVFVSWTQTGQPSASTIIELQPLSMITFAQEFGSGGITSLKISGADVFDAIITNDALVSDVATYTTSAPHSFAEGMLVSTAGLSNGSGIFNVTSQVITSIPTPTTFTIALFGNDVSFASDAGNAAVQAVPGLCVSYALLG